MSDVIDLSRTTKLTPKRKTGFCRCARVFVVEQTRMLECQDCGKVIDPFDFMMQEAKKQNSHVYQISHLKHEKEKLIDEVEDLKRQRRNLKAQVKRASSK